MAKLPKAHERPRAWAVQFSLDDLLRVANTDSDLQTLLEKIGLMGGQ